MFRNDGIYTNGITIEWFISIEADVKESAFRMILFEFTKRILNGWMLISFPLILHIANGERSNTRRPISNYDYYKPLMGRNAYSESSDDLNPRDEDKNWLGNDNYKTGSEELEDKPVYGYKAEEHHTSKHKPSDNKSPFNDNKQGYFSDWTYNKLNGWKSRGQNTPFSSQSHRDSPLKLSLDTSNEKGLDYKSDDAYPGKHPNQGLWETNDGQRSVNSSFRGSQYETEQIPRRPNNVELDVRVHKEHPVSHNNNYEDSPVWTKQKYSNFKSDADLEKEAEKEIRNVQVRNKWLGKKDQYHEDPASEDSGSEEKDGFLKDIRKHLHSLKSYPDFASRFNHGGHGYGFAYTPSKDMRHLIDANRKSTFLQEHEKKLEEMQKKHMESFEKFMGKPFHGGKKMFSGYKNQEFDEMYGKPSYDTKTHILESEYPAEADPSSVFIKL